MEKSLSLSIALLMGLFSLVFSLPTYAGTTPPKCPKPQDIQGSQVRFDRAQGWGWGNTFDLETSKSYPVGTDRNWTFYLRDLPAANQNEAIQKANKHVSSSTWELETEDAGILIFSWICAYRVDGNLVATAGSPPWDTK